VNVTVLAAVTLPVEMATGAVVEPDGTVTVAGADAEALSELAIVTAAPPDGAGALSVIAPLAAAPAVTVPGEIVKAPSVTTTGCGFTVSDAVLFAPPYVAVKITVLALVTLLVDTPNDADVAPAGTVTVDGAEADELSELAMLTVTPPAGAAPLSVIVPLAAVPPVSELGEIVIAAVVTGFTVMVPVFVTPR